MAEQLKGVQVNDAFVVDVKEDGVSMTGYPKTFSILNAIGRFPAITKDQWNREPFGNQEQRREALLDYIAAVEGVSRATIDASRTNRMWMYSPSGGGTAVASPPNGTPVTAIAPGVNLRGRTITFGNTSKPFSWTGLYVGQLMVHKSVDGIRTGDAISLLAYFPSTSGDGTTGNGANNAIVVVNYPNGGYDTGTYIYANNIAADGGGVLPLRPDGTYPSGSNVWVATTYTFPDDADYFVEHPSGGGLDDEPNNLGIIDGEMSVTDQSVNWSFRDATLTA